MDPPSVLRHRCNHEYLDLYTEVEDLNQDLITTPFGGRYCGRTVPRKRVSLYRILVFGFYTDQTSVNEQIFRGTYEFIDAGTQILCHPLSSPTPQLTQSLDQAVTALT